MGICGRGTATRAHCGRVSINEAKPGQYELDRFRWQLWCVIGYRRQRVLQCCSVAQARAKKTLATTWGRHTVA